MRAKLGLRSAADGDRALVTSLLDVMRISAADFTATFGTLSSLGAPLPAARAAALEALLPAIARRCGGGRPGGGARAARARIGAAGGAARSSSWLTLLQTNPAALAVFGHPTGGGGRGAR